ncbi:TPA: hypothetical protein ACGE6X_003646, partial [Serratia marcescens]
RGKIDKKENLLKLKHASFSCAIPKRTVSEYPILVAGCSFPPIECQYRESQMAIFAHLRAIFSALLAELSDE